VLRAHAVERDDGAPVGTIDADGRLATASGLLALDEVQPEGKAAMPGAAWRAGVRAAAPSIEP
jgi:methionyl-tRNA formyltransferase